MFIGNIRSSVLPKGTKGVMTDRQEDTHTHTHTLTISLSLSLHLLSTKSISLRLSLWGVRKEQHVGSCIECEILNMFVIYRECTNTAGKGQHTLALTVLLFFFF